MDRFLKNKRLEYGKAVNKCKLIYIDTLHWINIIKEDSTKSASEESLLNKAMKLVDSGKYLFPISEITFWELLKHNDLNTIKRSAQVVDVLYYQKDIQ